MDIPRFLKESWDDINSPTTSEFTNLLPRIKELVYGYDQVVEMDRSGVTKLKKAIKAVLNSGKVQMENEKIFAESLEKLGEYSLRHEQDSPEIGEAFYKFAIVAKDVSNLLKDLMGSLKNAMMFPIENFVTHRETQDGKKPFDKSLKELENRFHKAEKERLRLAELAGMRRSGIAGSEVAEETDRERKLLQLHTCEYLLKVNEARSKKGVDMLNHLVEYYQAQTRFFQDGLQTLNHFNTYITSLSPKLIALRNQHEEERRGLVALKENLQNALVMYKDERDISLPRASEANIKVFVPMQEVGTEHSGYLLKKSEGKFKKLWQKRKCTIKDGVMFISHSDETKQPVKLNLLTCQAKTVVDDTKPCFDLLSSSNNRTYRFQADDDADLSRWISVLNNAKEEQLLIAFSDEKGGAGTENIRELRKQMISEIKKLAGNNCCCDCGENNPNWLSVNFGVLLCIECIGVHRELGVHISFTQSLDLDDIGTSQLLIASVMSNSGFNEIMEAALTPENKNSLINPKSNRDARNTFIRNKYETRRYIIKTTGDSEELMLDLLRAVRSFDFSGILQAFAEGADLMAQLPAEDTGETALHKAVIQEKGKSLHIVDFLVQNSDSKRLDTKDHAGNTALHVAADYNQGEAMKLILRANPAVALTPNAAGKLPLDIATENKFHLCVELLQHAAEGKTSLFENVNIDWLFSAPDNWSNDFSDDELENTLLSPDPNKSRPTSFSSDAGGRKSSEMESSVNPPQYNRQSDRRKTSEIKMDTSTNTKKSTLDRVRRKTTDNILAQISNSSLLSSSSPGKSFGALRLPSRTTGGSIKDKLMPRFGHSRAISDHSAMQPPSSPNRHRDIYHKLSTTSQSDSSSHRTSQLEGSRKSSLLQTSQTRLDQPEVYGSQTRLNSFNTFKGSNSRMNQLAVDKSKLDQRMNQSNPSINHFDQSGKVTLSENPSLREKMPPPPLPEKKKPAPPPASTKPPGPITGTSLPVEPKQQPTPPVEPITESSESYSPATSTSPSQPSSGSSRSSLSSHPPPVPMSTSHTKPAKPPTTSNLNNNIKTSPTPQTAPQTTAKPSPISAKSQSIRRTNSGATLFSPAYKSQSVKVAPPSVPGGGTKPEILPRRGNTALTHRPTTKPKPKAGTPTIPGVLTPRRRCRALYDCTADQQDELSFKKDEVIVVIRDPPDSSWWEGEIDGNPKRRGLFPLTHVTQISDT